MRVAKYLLPFLILMIFSCNEDDIMEETDLSLKSLFTFKVPDSYYELRPFLSRATTAILTDEDGERILTAGLVSGETTDFVSTYDINNKSYDLNMMTIFEEEDGLRTYVTIRTFVDISPNEIELTNSYLIDPNPDSLITSISINSEGSAVESYYGPTDFIDYGYEHVFTKRLTQNPTDLYLCFNNEGQDFGYATLQENLTEDSDISLQYSDLEKINQKTIFSFPENDFAQYYIRGAKNSNPELYHLLYTDAAIFGETELGYYIPQNMFDKYYMLNIIRIDDKEYQREEYTDQLETQYKFPELDLTVLRTEPDDIALSTPSQADYFQLWLRFRTSDNSQNLSWHIRGKSAEEVLYKIPDLEDEIKAYLPEYSEDELEFLSARLDKVTGDESYQEHICRLLLGEECGGSHTMQESLNINLRF